MSASAVEIPFARMAVSTAAGISLISLVASTQPFSARALYGQVRASVVAVSIRPRSFLPLQTAAS